VQKQRNKTKTKTKKKKKRKKEIEKIIKNKPKQNKNLVKIETFEFKTCLYLILR